MDTPDHVPSVGEAEEQPAHRSSERRRVLARYRQIRGLGFAGLEARLLAESDADLALIRKLIGDGCPPPLAFRIAL